MCSPFSESGVERTAKNLILNSLTSLVRRDEFVFLIKGILNRLIAFYCSMVDGRYTIHIDG